MQQNLKKSNDDTNVIYLIDFRPAMRWAVSLSSLYDLYKFLNPKDIAEIILSTPYDRCSEDEYFWYSLEKAVPDDEIDKLDLTMISYFVECYAALLDTAVKVAIPNNSNYGNCVFSGWVNETTMMLIDYDHKEKVINSLV